MIEGVQVGDIGPDTDWLKALYGMDAVVHLAARVHIMDDTASDPLAAFRWVNVKGTERLAQQAVDANVRCFFYEFHQGEMVPQLSKTQLDAIRYWLFFSK